MVIPMMIIETFSKWFLKKVTPEKLYKGVRLSFVNASSEVILLFRVIISDKTYEFRNLDKGVTIGPILIKETSTYFFTYVMTPTRKLFYRPLDTQMTDIVTNGKLKVYIYIEKNTSGKEKLLLYPEKS